MNRIHIIVAVIISSILLVSVGSFVLNLTSSPDPFYVGVTYCGQSTEDAKLLIDRVKNYSNLFVLQSGGLQFYPDKINEIGDYAVSSGMYFMVYYGKAQTQLESWLETSEGWWDDRFLGVYYGDEPAGKNLDDYTTVLYDASGNSINFGLEMLNPNDVCLRVAKDSGRIIVTGSDNNYVIYEPDGKIIVDNHDDIILQYEPNGKILGLVWENNSFIEVPVDSSQVDSYEDLWNLHPFPTHEKATDFFINYLQSKLEYLNNNSITAFTSDYALYWFDYKAGYDVLLAQFGWNHTLTQDIALVRGAARLQNKAWGAIITWKYNQSPYLDCGPKIYNQMRTAYEAGAKYVVIFNYAEDMEGPYGTLQDEHFEALEQFWNDVVQSSAVKHGSVEAEAVLVLPENYGWGMRNPEEPIWGIWAPDEKSQQIWELSRNLLEQYGLGLDIVYEDSEFPLEGKYSQIFYWNQTN